MITHPAIKKPAFDIPSIKEYFVDLDYILGVISDGPTKSYAFRRLKYLASKFTMYTLLNEFQELADMKVCRSIFCFSHLIYVAKTSAYRSSVKLQHSCTSANLLLISHFQGFLQRSKSRYPRSPLQQHEPEASSAIYQI